MKGMKGYSGAGQKFSTQTRKTTKKVGIIASPGTKAPIKFGK